MNIEQKIWNKLQQSREALSEWKDKMKAKYPEVVTDETPTVSVLKIAVQIIYYEAACEFWWWSESEIGDDGLSLDFIKNRFNRYQKEVLTPQNYSTSRNTNWATLLKREAFGEALLELQKMILEEEKALQKGI